MNKLLFISCILSCIFSTSCTFNGRNYVEVKCENFFTLVRDFNHRFPDQDDYMLFLKSGYYETFYDEQKNGYNCHYHLEYKNGNVIDDWGNYTCDGRKFIMNYSVLGTRNPIFSFYHSSTIDFHIIDTLEYENLEYKIVFQARYIFSARG